MVTLTGPWAGIGVAFLALILLFTPARFLYYKNRMFVRHARPDPPVPLWAKIFFRVLGLLLLALAAALIWPAL